MKKESEEQKRLYCKQMKEMAVEDRKFIKLDTSIIRDEPNDMELGKKIRTLWNKKDKEIEERLLWIEKRMNETE